MVDFFVVFFFRKILKRIIHPKLYWFSVRIYYILYHSCHILSPNILFKKKGNPVIWGKLHLWIQGLLNDLIWPILIFKILKSVSNLNDYDIT
jgi:hypothetical protein